MEQTYVEQLEEIVEAVAHIGIDFGFGAFELEPEHIQKARRLLAQRRRSESDGRNQIQAAPKSS